MTPQEINKANSRRALAAVDKGDFSVIDELAAPDFRLEVAGNPDMDLAGFKGFCGMFAAAFPGFTHELEDMIAEGDKVVRVGTFHGTHKGEFIGIPATGKQVSMSFASVDTFKDGKVRSIRVNTDMLSLMQQLGAIPAPSHA